MATPGDTHAIDDSEIHILLFLDFFFLMWATFSLY